MKPPNNMTMDPAMSPLRGLLKLDQVAFIARSSAEVSAIKKQFRLTSAKWIEDEVVAEGYVRGARQPGANRGNSYNRARLLFNYDLGIELEILQYLEGPNYADINRVPSGHLCHIGFHVEKGKALEGAMVNFTFAAPIIQQVETQTHTNPFLLQIGRRYRYTIYDTREVLGTHLKVIERLEA